MTIEELQEKMQAVIAKADAENRSLNDDEVQEYEGLEKQLAAVRRDAEVRKRHEAYQTPIAGAPALITADKGDEALERAFDQYLRTGQRSMELTELRAQGEASGAAGGYTVPDGFRNKIIERMKAFGGIQSAAEVITTSSGNPLNWPTMDDTANSGEIVAEHGTGSNGADIVFDTDSLGAYKYMSLGASNLPLRVSVELLQDSAFDVQALVSRVLGKRIARAMAVDFAVGTGTGEPEGLFNKAGAVALASSSGNFTYQKLLDLVHTVDPDYRASASWVFNDAILAKLQGMVDGNSRPLLSDAQSSIAGSPGGARLLGYPVVIDQAVAGLGDNAKIAAFGDIREAFVIRKVKDVTLVVDPYGRAANGEVQFTAWARADSKIQNSNAYAILTDFDAP